MHDCVERMGWGDVTDFIGDGIVFVSNADHQDVTVGFMYECGVYV